MSIAKFAGNVLALTGSLVTGLGIGLSVSVTKEAEIDAKLQQLRNERRSIPCHTENLNRSSSSWTPQNR